MAEQPIKLVIIDIIANCPSATMAELEKLSEAALREIHYAIYHY